MPNARRAPPTEQEEPHVAAYTAGLSRPGRSRKKKKMNQMKCPVGSVYAMGLFTTYAYRFWSWGIERRPRRSSGLRKRPIVGSYQRECRYIRFGVASRYSPV